MLHRETLAPGTLDLLTSLSADPTVATFSLAGGTSLALRFGHRTSVDLDWFSTEPFDSEALLAGLRGRHQVTVTRLMNHCLAGTINGVKVDFVLYRYPLAEEPEIIERVRMLSLADVVPMKLAAIANRGAQKDFFDAHTLIQRLGLPAMIAMYQKKFPDNDPAIVLRSLCWFNDAEATATPETLIAVTWPDVKRLVAAEVKKLL